MARSILVAGLFGVALASPASALPSADAVLAGWEAELSRLGSLPAYRLEGRCVSALPGFPGGGDRTIVWRSLVSGRRYRFEWEIFGEEKRVQSYDGKVWHLRSGEGATARGSAYHHPDKTVEADLDEEVDRVAGGGWFPTLAFLVEKPFNIGGRSVLAEFKARSAHLSVRATPGGYALLLEPVIARQSTLPERVGLKATTVGFFPENVRFVFRTGDREITANVRLDGWKKGVGFDYPSRVSSQMTAMEDGKTRRLESSAYALTATAIRPPPLAAFRLSKAGLSEYFDDSVPIRPAPEPGTPLWTGTGGASTAVAVVMAILGLGLLIHSRRRR